jgi:hypothetical protein
MEVHIEQFLSTLFSLVPVSQPVGGGITCCWAATFGAYTFAAFLSRADGSVEMLSPGTAAGDFIYRDWAARHTVAKIASYDDWLRQKKSLEPLSWNWGWARQFGAQRRQLHLFDDVHGDSGLPEAEDVDLWRRQQFGGTAIAYPKLP